MHVVLGGGVPGSIWTGLEECWERMRAGAEGGDRG